MCKVDMKLVDIIEDYRRKNGIDSFAGATREFGHDIDKLLSTRPQRRRFDVLDGIL